MRNDPSPTCIEQVLREQGEIWRPIEGNSMMPLLDETTDIVKLVAAPPRLARYDLPLYRRPSGELVLHRIIKVRRNHYIICGDNRTRYERVPYEWVIALAVGRYRQQEYLDFYTPEFLADVQQMCKKRDSLPQRLRHWISCVWNRIRGRRR